MTTADKKTTVPPRRQDAGQPNPGKIHGRVDVEFHTGEAVALVNGRGKENSPHAIIGLKSFALQTQRIMKASLRGDPFADYCLAMIDDKTDEVDAYMKERGLQLRQLAEERLDPGMSPEKGVAYKTTNWSIAPVEEEFVLGRYSSRALFCLVQFDKMVLLAKGMHHHKVINEKECQDAIKQSGTKLRGLLAIGRNYHFLGCTRKDLQEKNARARETIRKLVDSRFLNLSMFNGIDDICETFSDYEVVHKPGSGESLADAEDSTDETGETVHVSDRENS